MPATSQMRCWLLPNGRIFPAVAGDSLRWAAVLHLHFSRCPHVGATLAFPVAPRTHSLSERKAAHSGDTRLTAANGARCGRVQGCKPFKALPPCPLAPANARAIGRRGATKECRDFALQFSASALKCRAALQAQGLPRLVSAASETCAARPPSAWSLSAPARCRSGCCQRSRRRSLSTESHTRGEARMQWTHLPAQGCFYPALQCGAYHRFSAAQRSRHSGQMHENQLTQDLGSLPLILAPCSYAQSE